MSARGWRKIRVLAAMLLVTAAIGTTTGVALAAFIGTTSNGGNSITASTDLTPPTVTATVVAKTTGYLSGYVNGGGSATYYVYANVTDIGTPATGVSSVMADVRGLTTGGGAGSVALSSGSFSVGGVTYNYRSASQTANKNGLNDGSVVNYTVDATDANGNSTNNSNNGSVTIDSAAPTATDVQATNHTGGTAGKPEVTDKITFTFSEEIDPESILSGWTGASTNVTVRINDGGAGNDTLLVYNSANSAQLPLGSVNLGGTGYVTANAVFGSSGTRSTMVESSSSPWTIIITLGQLNSGTAGTQSSNTTMTWTTNTADYDRAGNTLTTTSVTEGGSADKEF